MEHSMPGLNRKTLSILVVLVAGALIAVYAFNVSWNTIGYLGLIGFMFLMHGGHGGMHGGHGNDSQTHDHAGDTGDTPGAENAKAVATDGNARGLASTEQAKSVKPEESHQHRGC